MDTVINNRFNELYKQYSLNSDIVLKDALHSFLLDEKRKYLIELNQIFRKYKAEIVAELENLIKSDKNLEHLGWEDLIECENLVAEIRQLDHDIKAIR